MPREERSARHRVLIIDDEESTRLLLARYLSKDLKIEAQLAGTCEQALRFAGDYAYDAILLDLLMPGIGGLEAIDRILAMKDITPESKGPEEFNRQRRFYANGMGGLPIIGDADHVAKSLADLSNAGLTGIGISFINYLDELPFFRDEVLPRLERLGVREPIRTTLTSFDRGTP